MYFMVAHCITLYRVQQLLRKEPRVITRIMLNLFFACPSMFADVRGLGHWNETLSSNLPRPASLWGTPDCLVDVGRKSNRRGHFFAEMFDRVGVGQFFL